MTPLVLVGIGGCVGAILRFVLAASDRIIPWGMMTANVLASATAGALMDLDGSWRWLINVGVLGAMSTWSALAVAAVRLAEEEGYGAALAVLLGTVSASIAAAWAMLQL
jgi:CrcB protein